MKVYGFFIAPLTCIVLLSSICQTTVSAQIAVVQQNSRALDENAVDPSIASTRLQDDDSEDRGSGWFDAAGSFLSEVVPGGIWEKVAAVGGDVEDFAKSQLQDIEKQLEDVSHQMVDLKERVQHIVTASRKLRVEVSAKAEQHGFTIEDFSQELEGHWAIVTGELEGMFHPMQESSSHDDRLALAEGIFDKVEAGLIEVGTKFNIVESEIRAFCEAARPHVIQVVMVIGDVAEEHPVLVNIILSTFWGIVIAEVAELWILPSLLRLFGFGLAGPIKGSAAALIQKTFFGKAVPAKSVFAILQGMGMKGVGKGSAVGGAIAGAIGGVIGAVVGTKSKSA